jgi:hypothetical protein
VGDRRAKSTHKAIKTSIFPRIIIAKEIAIRIVKNNGRDDSLMFPSCIKDNNVSFE